MSTTPRTPNQVKMKRQQEVKTRLAHLKDVLMREFIKRVKAGEPSGDVLAEMNKKWCQTCDNAKAHPATKELFALEVDKLADMVNQVDRRETIVKWAGRGVSALIIILLSAGTYAAIEFLKPFFKQ